MQPNYLETPRIVLLHKLATGASPYPVAICPCLKCEKLLYLSERLSLYGSWNLENLLATFMSNYMWSWDDLYDYLQSRIDSAIATQRRDVELESKHWPTVKRQKLGSRDLSVMVPGQNMNLASEATSKPCIPLLEVKHPCTISGSQIVQGHPCLDTTAGSTGCELNWDGTGHDSRLPFTYFGDKQALVSPPGVKRWPNRHTELLAPLLETSQSGGTGTTDSETSSSMTSTVGSDTPRYSSILTDIQPELISAAEVLASWQSDGFSPRMSTQENGTQDSPLNDMLPLNDA